MTHAVRRAAARAFAVAVLAHGLAARASDIAITVQDEAGAAVADAVVIAVPATGVKLPLPKPEVVVQEDKEFRPFVKAVLVGTPVQFPNRDDVLHHVYSFSPPKPFELKAYAGTPQEPVVFDRPGPVALGCNIHDWMLAYIYVSESPHFVTTAADGTARLARLPQGSYTVRVWHPRLAAPEASTARAVVVGANGAVEAAWTLKLKRDSRVRRAPSASGRGYR